MRAGPPWRALILAIPLATAAAAAASYSDLYYFKKLGSYQLPPGAVAILLMVLTPNLILKRLAPSWTLGLGELLLIYSAVAVGALIGGAGGDSAFLPTLVYPYYFATPGNRLAELVYPYTPKWLVPEELHASARWFFEGLRPGMSIPWLAWISPLVAWSLLLLGIYGISVAVSLLVYDRWAGHERLRFPLTEIPLALVGSPVGASRLHLRVGFAITAAFGLLQGLHYSFPIFPEVVLRWTLPAPIGPPWNAWGETIINLSPAVVGLSYLISTDVCFSLVGFHLLFRLMNVATIGMGLPLEREQDYWVWKEYQALFCFGGYVALAATMLWPVAVAWLAGKSDDPARGRAGGSAVRSDRRAGRLLLGSLALVATWLLALGLSPAATAAVIIVYLVFAIVLTRAVCEIGLFLIQPPLLPTDILAGLGIARHGPDAALLCFVMPSVLFDIRGSVMPALFQGLKLAESSHTPTRWTFGAMLAVIPFALAAAYVVHLLVFYRYGALQCQDVWSARMQAGIGFDLLAQRASGDGAVPWSRLGWMGTGTSALLLLLQLRRMFLWLPIHPVGMVMSVSYPSVTLWASLTVGGMLKLALLRYGGKRLHDKGKDVAIGWALGHVAVTLFWYLFDFATGTSMRPSGLE